jgi:hypothetical protein
MRISASRSHYGEILGFLREYAPDAVDGYPTGT